MRRDVDASIERAAAALRLRVDGLERTLRAANASDANVSRIVADAGAQLALLKQHVDVLRADVADARRLVSLVAQRQAAAAPDMTVRRY